MINAILTGVKNRNLSRICFLVQHRRVTTVSEIDTGNNANESTREGCLFIDSMFPVILGGWDVRHYIGVCREEFVLEQLGNIFRSVKTHGFRLVSLDSRTKDGGVFVNFTYNAEKGNNAIKEIVNELRAETSAKGGIPSWTGIKQTPCNIWEVEGTPWREDLHRFASPMLKVSFDGPDIREENLYNMLRPFGRIADLTPPTPGSNGALRYSIVVFRHLRSAVIAHNCIHGRTILSSGGATTSLQTMYERPLKAHAIRDWITGHPRISIPVLVFLLGSITYTIFDPIRVFAVESKLLHWFDYRESPIYQWLRKNTVDRLSFALSSQESSEGSTESGLWKDRQNAEASIASYLADSPNTITFVHGPQGSGKSRMLFSLLKNIERPVLTIDCAELYKAGSDSALLMSLAKQTGYWPVFPFVNSLNNLIDIASVGLMGQKAGLSTSLESQVQQILEVVGSGLKGASLHESQRSKRKIKQAEEMERRRTDNIRRYALMQLGTWHDGRLDCVSGNGVMCELGIGDEFMRPEDYDVDLSALTDFDLTNSSEVKSAAKQKSPTELQSLRSLPIVIIKNFATKRGKDSVIEVLSKWAATLANNKIAHVIVVSDNRENSKSLAQALPSKPLHTVALSDADSSSALSFVAQKLHGGGIKEQLTADQQKSIERLGGRASDLESLMHKVRSGQRVEDAVEDIISKGVSELRKNAFGEDAEDAKNLAWTREQAWAIMKQLSKEEEIPYHETVINFPFKGDEVSLRNMEHAELITIGTKDGRPTDIKPGRPVYRYVFKRLIADSVFCAMQDIASNEKQIASAESTIKVCEEELLKLHEIGITAPHWWSKRTATQIRALYLMRKMQNAELTLEKLEAANVELKKTLKKGE